MTQDVFGRNRFDGTGAIGSNNCNSLGPTHSDGR